MMFIVRNPVISAIRPLAVSIAFLIGIGVFSGCGKGSSGCGSSAEGDGGPVTWAVTVNDPAPGKTVAIPENSLPVVEWMRDIDVAELAAELVSGFGEPGDARRLEWTMLSILLARLAGTVPAESVSGVVVRQGADWRIIGVFSEPREDGAGKVSGRKLVYVDRVISGLTMARTDFAAFCRWRYGVVPW
jgi:hypothetical protein